MLIDFKGMKAEKTDVILISEGRHQCRITEIEVTKSKKGDDYLVISFVPEGIATIHKEWFSLVKGKRWSIKKLLIALGLMTSTDDDVSINTDKIEGRDLWVDFVHKEEEYIDVEGYTRKVKKNKIKGFEGLVMGENNSGIPF